jgi:hypothetical protein
MSAQEGHPPNPSTSHHDARAGGLERVLHAYGGTLTRARLYELSGADHWATGDCFDQILDEAVGTGRIRRLGDELLHASDG